MGQRILVFVAVVGSRDRPNPRTGGGRGSQKANRPKPQMLLRLRASPQLVLVRTSCLLRGERGPLRFEALGIGSELFAEFLGSDAQPYRPLNPGQRVSGFGENVDDAWLAIGRPASPGVVGSQARSGDFGVAEERLVQLW